MCLFFVIVITVVFYQRKVIFHVIVNDRIFAFTISEIVSIRKAILFAVCLLDPCMLRFHIIATIAEHSFAPIEPLILGDLMKTVQVMIFTGT